MRLWQLQSRLANLPGSTLVRIRISGPNGSEVSTEVVCVETVLDEKGAVIVLGNDGHAPTIS